MTVALCTVTVTVTVTGHALRNYLLLLLCLLLCCATFGCEGRKKVVMLRCAYLVCKKYGQQSLFKSEKFLRISNKLLLKQNHVLLEVLPFVVRALLASTITCCAVFFALTNLKPVVRLVRVLLGRQAYQAYQKLS